MHRPLAFAFVLVAAVACIDSSHLETQYVLCDSFCHSDCGYPNSVTCDDGSVVTAAYCAYDWRHPEWGACAIAVVYHRDVFRASENDVA